MYENALNLDPRHYNAWHRAQHAAARRSISRHVVNVVRWGLGNIYHRQEEHENLGCLGRGTNVTAMRHRAFGLTFDLALWNLRNAKYHFYKAGLAFVRQP